MTPSPELNTDHIGGRRVFSPLRYPCTVFNGISKSGVQTPSSPEFFRLLYVTAQIAFITARIIASLELHIRSSIYDSFHTSFRSLIHSSREDMNPQMTNPNISGFMAQLVRASQRHHEFTGSNTVEILNFSGFSTK